ncbi:MAG: Hpt domain-containing protein [Chromatiaceae bacterium]|jgi:chemotaxis protein histidine kinase CheA|nr:Hpt domain-containing protein [Chromatiaceae bacterium]
MAQDRWHIPTTEDEIVDVFVEEVGELVATIDRHLKDWTADPGDKKALTEIRRSFHTLKGSGRMVRALDLSEMAWKVENMLNQAIAGTVSISDPMVKLVAAARAQIPRAAEAFKSRRRPGSNPEIETLMKRADALAAGREQAAAVSALPASAAAGRQLQEVNLKLDRVMQRADEALHRSEMALQQARRAGALSEIQQRVVSQRDTGAELDRIGEAVKQLTKEVTDLRTEARRAQREPAIDQGEVNRLVEQRVRAKLAPNMERLRSEMKQGIEENLQAVTAQRRFGWLALVLSALLGGLIGAWLLLWTLSIG